MHIFKNTKFDFLRWRWHAIALSWVVILAGLAVIFTKGIPLGIEFAGGTQVIAQFDNAPSVEAVRSALQRSFPGGDERHRSSGRSVRGAGAGAEFAGCGL